MSRGMPSMTALLGMLALAGYQNRDKLGELFGNAVGSLSKPEGGGQPQAQSDALSKARASTGVGGLLGGGLGELLEQFKKIGQGEAAESWIDHGPNNEISARPLKQASCRD